MHVATLCGVFQTISFLFSKSNLIVGALGSTWDHDFCMGSQINVTTITRAAHMGASLYLCGSTIHVAKTMWVFQTFSFLLSLHGSLKKLKTEYKFFGVENYWDSGEHLRLYGCAEQT